MGVVMSNQQGNAVETPSWTLSCTPAERTMSMTFTGEWASDVRRYVFTNCVRHVYGFYTMTSLVMPAELGDSWTVTWKQRDPDIKADF